ncbi:nose resistant to fluoxetine protein 6 isoform X2 [Monomorium pharaonis]|uniref:nose resistant to fluoxetine protein 6 isoform X2 n=1 Tax=Monomorium pharaonis TaxID=307658 RepID=UPI00063FD0C1|nr:nose resistant to fluoxetine protein 6 isoform X2 [Monomorium pharaonis]
MSQRQLTFILCVCVNFTTLLSAQIHKWNNDNSKNNYMLPGYAVAAVALGLLNSTLCEKELLNFRDAVDQRVLWSLRMLDSSGEFQSGFLGGNTYWLGSQSQCFDTMNITPLQLSERLLLNNTLYRDPQKEFPPFKVNYFAAHFKHNSTLQYHINLPNENVITLGLCLPASCSVNDISLILKRIFRDRVLLINDLYSIDFELIQVKDLKNNYKWFISGAILVICVILVLSIFMVIIGTLYDILISQKYLNKKNKIDTNGKNTIQIMEMEADLSLQESRIGKILMCFSVYANTKVIFNTKSHPDTVPVIHSLKFLSMCWLIMAHTATYIIDYIDNKIVGWKISSGFGPQILSNATLGVDTYFFLSGFLVAYFYIKDKLDKDRIQPFTYRAKINEFIILVTRRFIRLTPAYMAVLAISQLISTWFDKTSLFYIYERPHETCSKYWWRNLIYINNLFGLKEMCMSWSWYLSADMQFFMIAVALLILSTILDEQYRLIDVLYFPSWTRISPYIVGMITGYVLTQLNGKLVLKRRTVILCWCLGSACNIVVLFGIYKRHIPVLPTAIYIALHRGIWALGIAWIVMACLTEHGGIVCRFLSFKGWAPFSRLSYCAYLLNPIIIHSLRLQSETSVHFSLSSLTVLFIGHFIIIYFSSYILSLIVETPYSLLMRKIMQTRSRRKYKWRNSEKL